MVDKLDGIWSYKTMTSSYGIFQRRQIWRIVDKKNNSRTDNVKKNNYNRWLGNNKRDQKEQHQGTAKIYRDNIWKLHRVPRKILSDWGPQFTSKFMGELTKVLETMRQLLTAYHSQTDGQTERINQEIGMFLRHYINYQQDN